ncbi:Sulfur carrier protein adenylyltransferase ThiF [plant metagenome]|uniref:Sulfur carrier protein adenylyltransferase ThiF n=1 Tax=plant metagenome TaxID=1297885 RepID=A0A484SMA2_9ZZZZ
MNELNDAQLLRYARHILLDEIGIEGQQKLINARALVVGAGGLGSPAAVYLASAGVGEIVLADHDAVELSNLQRQILHTTARIGKNKAESGKQMLEAINPEVQVRAQVLRLEDSLMELEVAAADVVLDCTDNFETRHALNEACVLFSKPLVSGAAIRFGGQVTVFDQRKPGSACYHCLFPDTDTPEEMNCATSGVFAPVVGIIGAMQAAEALKLIMGLGESLDGRMQWLDALTMQWRSARVQRDPECRVCGVRPHAGKVDDGAAVDL